MATVEERLVEIHTQAAMTCEQIVRLIQGVEDALDNDPNLPPPDQMPPAERAALVRLVATWKATAHAQHCPGF